MQRCVDRAGNIIKLTVPAREFRQKESNEQKEQRARNGPNETRRARYKLKLAGS